MKKYFLIAAMVVLQLSMALTLSAAAGENQIRSFVYHWFSLFDRNAPVGEFLRHLPEKDFLMAFPEASLKNHSDFRAWYKGILNTVSSANHELKKVNIKGTGTRFEIELVVLWRAKTVAGQSLSFDAFQTWKVEMNKANVPMIKEYLVFDGKGYQNATGFKIKVKNEPAFGGFVTIASHKIVENLAIAGKLDFVWIEAEHTEFGPVEVQNLAIAAENEGLTAVVRVPENQFDSIKKYLGTGVQGVVVPGIKTAEDARNAINAVKYAPQGARAAGVERANRYLGRFADFKARANDEMLAVLMIETKEAVENIEEIVRVPGIDILHIGPFDLSLSLGVDMKSEKLARAIKRVEIAASQNRIPLGSYAPDMDSAKEKAKKGYRFFTIPGDMEYLQNGVKSFFE